VKADRGGAEQGTNFEKEKPMMAWKESKKKVKLTGKLGVGVKQMFKKDLHSTEGKRREDAERGTKVTQKNA